MSLEDETLHLLEGTFHFLSPYTPLWSESSTLGDHTCHTCGLYHAFMRDDLALEHFYFTLGASLGVLLTYPLLYHGLFMYCGLISRVCKEIKALFYFLRDFARKILLF
jgi:hypothetical protein